MKIEEQLTDIQFGFRNNLGAREGLFQVKHIKLKPFFSTEDKDLRIIISLLDRYSLNLHWINV